MKKPDHPIDSFFRETLTDHRMVPSKAAKEAFLKEATEPERKKNKGRKGFLLLVIFIIAVSAGSIWVALSPEKNISQSFKKHPPDTTQTSSFARPLASSDPNLNQPIKNSETTVNPTLTESRSHHQPNHEIFGSSEEKQVVAAIGESLTPAEPGPSSKQNKPATDTGVLSLSGVPDITSEISPYDQRPDTNNRPMKPDSALFLKPVIDNRDPKETVGNRKWQISTGLYYTPEWMFNTLEGIKPATNFGIEGTFRIGCYSIRTGAGLSITKGTNQVAVEYQDYLGSYMKLDSMAFAWDERHYYLIPTSFLTQKDVYDSLIKLDNNKVIKRYTYIQVPLILGYDFLRHEKFSMGVRLGPILSILLASKDLSGEYNPEKKQVISINMITPEQINLNWQIMGGINATFRLSPRIGIEIEPFVKYYLNSVYEYSGSSKPWSIGIRGAISINY